MCLTQHFSPEIPPLIDPATCLLPLPDKVMVSRLDEHTLHVRWQPTAVTTRFFAGIHPEQIDVSHPLAEVKNSQETTFSNPYPACRPYIAVQFIGGSADGQWIVTAERFLPLAGGVNFRDVGGYETADGRRLRWGTLYRSGVLSELTEPDQQYLGCLGLRLVCDMRTTRETRKRPNRLPADPHLQCIHLPAQNLERAARWRGVTAVLFNRSQLDSLMDEGYTRVMIDKNAALIGQVLRHLANPANYPAVIHCSAGKDRTAIVIALLLHMLGVPWSTILADYTLSNLHYDKFRAGIQADMTILNPLGITADHVQPIVLVKAGRLLKMKQHIEQTYGSIGRYLQDKAGLHEPLWAQLQANLLT